MNDRFKFKFYHNETEKMYEVKAICFEGRPTVTLQYNPVFKVPLDSGYLMQCTGLRDKKGKPIYENDFVLLNGEIWQVIWSDEDCAFFLSNLKETYHQPIYTDLYIMAKDFEVVGNIHETPELFEGK